MAVRRDRSRRRPRPDPGRDRIWCCAVNVPRAYRTAGAHDPGDAALLDLLEDRLVDYRATVHRTGESGIAGVVAGVLAERGARRIAKAPGLHLELGSDVTLLTDDEARSIAMLDSVDGVITGCAVAIAETGTIVLDASPVCGHRALTLVPDFYVAIVRREQVVESVSRGVVRSRPPGGADVGQWSVSHVGHRALTGRGRPWSAHVGGCPRQLAGSAISSTDRGIRSTSVAYELRLRVPPRCGTRTPICRRALVAYALYALGGVLHVDGDRAVSRTTGGRWSCRSGRGHPAASGSGPRPASREHRDRLPRGTALLVGYSCVALATRPPQSQSWATRPSWCGGRRLDRCDIAIGVVRPIHFAAFPQLARGGRELTSANSFSSVADALGAFLGPVLAGFTVTWQGPAWSSSSHRSRRWRRLLLCVHLRLSPRTQAVERGAEGWRAALGGLRALHRDWGSPSLLLVLANGFVLAGALDVLGVAFAEQVLEGGASSAGLVVGAMGVGGSASVQDWRRRSRIAAASLPPCSWQASSRASRSASSRYSATSPRHGGHRGVRASGALLMVLGRTLLQRATDDWRPGARVCRSGGDLVAGPGHRSLDRSAPRRLVHPIRGLRSPGCRAALVAVSGWFFVRRLDARAIYLPAERAVLSAHPFLAALPAYELERLAQRASWVDVRSGTHVVRQGDPGDQFFVVAEGELLVTVDGHTRPDRLRAGDSFGEIALAAVDPSDRDGDGSHGRAPAFGAERGLPRGRHRQRGRSRTGGGDRRGARGAGPRPARPAVTARTPRIMQRSCII